MSKVSEIWMSRERWKEKAVARRKRLKSRERLLRKWKDRATRAEEQLKEEQALRSALSVAVPEPNGPVIALCLQVRIRVIAALVFCIGVISARALPRILQLIQSSWNLPPCRIPHNSSVINWIYRAGLGLLKLSDNNGQRWIAAIDTSISYARQKLLIVLRVPLNHFAHSTGAPLLKDAECVGLKIADTWNGDSVLLALTKIFRNTGSPSVILKDGGGDIGKGVRLLRETQKGYVAIAHDIGHVVANELKRFYRRNTLLDELLKHINDIKTGVTQTDLASLRPPQLRTKGRFQGISRLSGLNGFSS